GYAAERFAELGAKVGGRGIEGLEYGFFALGLGLALSERFTGAAAYGFEPEHKGIAEAGDRAFDDRGALRALAKLVGQLAGQPGIGFLVHEAEGLLDEVLGNAFEERRLFPLHDHGLLEGFVENGIASGVSEIGQDNGVFIGDFARIARVPEEIAATGECG